jgi:hypothetical protein
MSQITDNVKVVLINHAKQMIVEYCERWVPNDQNIKEAISLFQAPEGFEPYTLEEIVKRQKSFWKCREEWLVSCKHNFSVFVKHIHRWVSTNPAQHPAAASAPQRDASYICPECHNKLLRPSDICEKCFPHCPECGMQHSPDEKCLEFAERERKLRQMFSHPDNRESKVKTLSGENAFEEKKMLRIKVEGHV